MSIEDTGKEQEVAAFLSKVRQSLQDPGFYLILDREKNRQALNDLDISPGVQRESISRLEVLDYYRGPSGDERFPDNTVFEFGICIDEREVYVKLAIVEKYGKVFCKCLSFHRAERSITYPLRQELDDE